MAKFTRPSSKDEAFEEYGGSEECGSHADSYFRDSEDIAGVPAPVKGTGGSELAVDDTQSLKGKEKVSAGAGVLLATSGVSRRLDFGKSPIARALAVARSGKRGLKKTFPGVAFGDSSLEPFLRAPPPSPSAPIDRAPGLGLAPLAGSSSTDIHGLVSQSPFSSEVKPASSFTFSPVVGAAAFDPSSLGPVVAEGVPSRCHVVTPFHASYPKEETNALADNNLVIPLASSGPPLLKINEISENSIRFCFQGKVLNKYGTYKLPILTKGGDSGKVARYLKSDLTDEDGYNTITLSIIENYISHFESKLIVGSFIRIEGPVVRTKNKNDGGTSSFCLNVDATTSILKSEPFECCLSFYPEISIRAFLEHSSLSTTPERKTPLATLAFVVINIDNTSRGGKSSLDLLTVADGPSAHDRASLSFVNDRRHEFSRMVADFDNGLAVMFVARNIGAWLSYSNTLSVLDCTILVPVRGAKKREELKSVFSKQIAIMGYGKEVYGLLEIVNINSVLLQLVCADCKSDKVRRTGGGTYCFACSSTAQAVETPKLEGRITRPDRTTVGVSIFGDIVDKILQFTVPFKDLYSRNVYDAREELASFRRAGTYVLSHVGRVISCIDDGGVTN